MLARKLPLRTNSPKATRQKFEGRSFRQNDTVMVCWQVISKHGIRKLLHLRPDSLSVTPCKMEGGTQCWTATEPTSTVSSHTLATSVLESWEHESCSRWKFPSNSTEAFDNNFEDNLSRQKTSVSWYRLDTAGTSLPISSVAHVEQTEAFEEQRQQFCQHLRLFWAMWYHGHWCEVGICHWLWEANISSMKHPRWRFPQALDFPKEPQDKLFSRDNLRVYEDDQCINWKDKNETRWCRSIRLKTPSGAFELCSAKSK